MLYRGTIQTARRQCVSITDAVCAMVRESGVREGFAIVFLPHATAGLAITSFWDERGLDDLLDELDRNVPARVTYGNQDSPFTTAAYVKNTLMGGYATLMIHGGKLVLGSSQGLVLTEYDGPRPREYWVQVVAAGAVHTRSHKITTRYMGMHDVTGMVEETICESCVESGVCHVAMLHSTAGLFVGPRNETAQLDVMDDIERMVPTRGDFKHRETASDAGGHIKTALAGSQVSLIVAGGRLLLGREQALLFAEFDGPRPRGFTVGVYRS